MWKTGLFYPDLLLSSLVCHWLGGRFTRRCVLDEYHWLGQVKEWRPKTGRERRGNVAVM
jgi:hypothetical protein